MTVALAGARRPHNISTAKLPSIKESLSLSLYIFFSVSYLYICIALHIANEDWIWKIEMKILRARIFKVTFVQGNTIEEEIRKKIYLMGV